MNCVKSSLRDEVEAIQKKLGIGQFINIDWIASGIALAMTSLIFIEHPQIYQLQ
jgi:hypothetical protein